MESALEILGLPREFGITLLLAALALLASPYLAGVDFGGIRLPNLHASLRAWLRWLAPTLLLIAIGVHIPMFPENRAPDNSLAILPVSGGTLHERQDDFATKLSSKILLALSANTSLKTVIARSVILSEKLSTAKNIAKELNVAYLVDITVLTDARGTRSTTINIIDKNGLNVATREYCMPNSELDTAVRVTSRLVAETISHIILKSQPARGYLQSGLSDVCDLSAVKVTIPHGVMFSAQTSAITAQFVPTIENLVKSIRGIETKMGARSTLIIESFVNESVDAQTNQRLSDERAHAVAHSLMTAGYKREEMSSLGMGRDASRASSRTEVLVVMY